MFEQLKQWDRELFVYLNGLGIEDYDNFWIWFTQIRHWIPLYILFFVLFFMAFHKKKAIYSSVFLLVSWAVTFGLTFWTKNVVDRLRPNNNPEINEIIRILQEPTNFSFFSGHTSSAFVLVTFVVLVLRKTYKWIWLLYIWAFMLSLSRIFVGVHYPSDLFVGGLVGVLMAWIFYKIYLKYESRFY
ncbi:MAG: phosphatase PAP2 family protein [Zunongwangia sp.]|uniref:Phosphatase PAP2 family protein n=1 Tax=Zunongwangia pacifica TaxID=2911062 RepID=A0A9X2A1K2_9FLAO|nr:phosphatase PAP2 family protein [Zunongwangia pacifica]MCL6218449.1 phosphatase PAP2 family protein [Zunongwangia pacifica]